MVLCAMGTSAMPESTSEGETEVDIAHQWSHVPRAHEGGAAAITPSTAHDQKSVQGSTGGWSLGSAAPDVTPRLMAKITEGRTALENKNRELTIVNATLKEKTLANSRLTEELKALSDRLLKIRESKTALVAEKDQTDRALQQKESDLVRITAKLSELEASKTVLEQEKAQTRARLQEKEVELARIQGRMEAMDQLAAAEKENLANKTSLIAGLQTQLQQVEGKAQAEILQVKRAAVDGQILALSQFLQLDNFGVNIQKELESPHLNRERFLGGLTATISPRIREHLEKQAFLDALVKNEPKIRAYSMAPSTASEVFVTGQMPISYAALKPALEFTFTTRRDEEHQKLIAANLTTEYKAAAINYGNHLISCCSKDLEETKKAKDYHEAVSTALQDLLRSCKPQQPS